MTRFKLITAFLAATLASTAAFAESGFPADFNAGVSGLKIGQSPAEAEAVLKDLFPEELVENTTGILDLHRGDIITKGDKRETMVSNLVDYDEFPVAMTASSIEEVFKGLSYGRIETFTRMTGGSASVIFSTPETGNRVETIYRHISYDSPKAPQAVLDQISAQYGEPHFQLGKNLLYGFRDGAPVSTTVSVPTNSCAASNNNLRKINVEKETGTLRPTKGLSDFFSPDAFKRRSNMSNRCHAGLRISMITDADQLITGLIFIFQDHKTTLEDMVALQEYFDAKAGPAPTGDTEVPEF